MEIPYEEILARLERIEKKINDQKPFEQVEIIDRAELRKRLKISEPTVIAMEKKKKFPVIRLGTSIRYDWFKVVKSLEKQKGG